jgi:hypothetical protein
VPHKEDTVSGVCLVCDKGLSLTWTDTHGAAQCMTCGAPYQVFHYEGEGDARRRVERPAELLLSEETLGEVRRCFAETGARISAVGMRLSFPGGYDVATREDVAKVIDWLDAREAVS